MAEMGTNTVDETLLKSEDDFESGPSTMVNTMTHPSPAPSIHGSSPMFATDLEAGNLEKKLEESQSSHLPGVDPITHLVDWDGPDDPANPMNFTSAKKWWITIILALVTFCVSFASSVFSTATTITAVQFDVSLEVMILGVSLYVLGFAFGPLIWAPLSEVYGRTRPLFVGFAIFVIFQIPLAVAQNLTTIMLSRFFAGCFGAAPIAIVGGTYVDFWNAAERGMATAGFAGATFLGPIAGPTAGSYITQSSLGWRWTGWITMIFSAAFGLIALFTVPETFAPVLMQRKAAKLRHQTKNWAIHSRSEETPIHFKSLMEKYFSKPLVMLFQEPILLALTIHSSLVYSILYLIFFAYPYAFARVRGWSITTSSLTFLSLGLGIFLCCIYIALDTRIRFNPLLARSGKFVLPEARLPPMILGSVLLPIGLFWFAWTSSPSIHPAPQIISGVVTGMGIFLVFLPAQVYIIDCYLMNANSALAATSFARALMAAGFPLFANYMYRDLGVDWATSLLGFLCVAMIPFPALFYVFGEKLRKKGKYAVAL